MPSSVALFAFIISDYPSRKSHHDYHGFHICKVHEKRQKIYLYKHDFVLLRGLPSLEGKHKLFVTKKKKKCSAKLWSDQRPPSRWWSLVRQTIDMQSLIWNLGSSSVSACQFNYYLYFCSCSIYDFIEIQLMGIVPLEIIWRWRVIKIHPTTLL